MKSSCLQPICPDPSPTVDYHDLIEHIPAVAFRLTHEGDAWKTVFVNQNISGYGYAQSDFMENRVTWFDLVHPDDRVLLSKTISDYEARGVNKFKLYYRVMTKSGDSIPVTEYNTVIRDGEGRIVCYDSIISDSALSESSQTLIKSHFQQHLVLNDILISLQDSDPDHAIQIILDRTGQYLDTSRALLFKDSPDHKTCKIVYEWCNEDIESVMALDYSITYETGMPEIYVALQTTGSLLINFNEIPPNCQEEFEAEGLIASAIFAVYLDGDHYGFVCFDDCVVERKWDEDTVRFLKNVANLISGVLARQKAAEQLAQNQKTYEAVLNNIDSYVFVIRPDSHNIIFANQSFKEKFGDDCVGQKISRYLPIGEELTTNYAEAANKTADRYPEIYSEKSGEWLSVSKEEITWVDGSQACLINCYNITATKEFAETLEEKIEERTQELQLMTAEAENAKEKAEEAALAKTRFLANMSHEVRTPMNVIMGVLQLAERTDSLEEIKQYLNQIDSSSNLLLRLLNEVLDISQIEDGKLTLTKEKFNLKTILGNILLSVEESANVKKQKLTALNDNMDNFEFMGDPLRLSQVLLNLTTNAVKFTPEGGEITFSVKCLENKENKSLLEFSVADNGIGISPELLERIFLPFEQGDNSISRKYGGTGLGLAVSKHLADLMGGAPLKWKASRPRAAVFPLMSGWKRPGVFAVKRPTIPQPRLTWPEAMF